MTSFSGRIVSLGQISGNSKQTGGSDGRAGFPTSLRSIDITDAEVTLGSAASENLRDRVGYARIFSRIAPAVRIPLALRSPRIARGSPHPLLEVEAFQSAVPVGGGLGKGASGTRHHGAQEREPPCGKVWPDYANGAMPRSCHRREEPWAVIRPSRSECDCRLNCQPSWPN